MTLKKELMRSRASIVQPNSRRIHSNRSDEEDSVKKENDYKDKKNWMSYVRL